MTLTSQHPDPSVEMPGLRTPAPDRRKRTDALILALWWLLLAGLAVLWLRLDNRFPSGDVAFHLTNAIEVSRVLARPSLDWLARMVAAAQGQPPLYAFLTAPLIWMFGPGADPAVLVNLAFLGLLLASTYGIVRGLERLHGADNGRAGGAPSLRWPALAAALLVSLYPLVVAFVRLYNPAIAITALVALAIWLLVGSYGPGAEGEALPLRRRRYAIGFGLILIVGMLTGVGFWAYVLGPALLVAAGALRVRRPAAVSKRRPSRTVFEKLGRRLRLAPSQVNLILAALVSLLAFPIALAFGLPLAAGSPAALVASLAALDDAMGGFLLLLALAGVVVGLVQLVRPSWQGARLAFGLVLFWLGSATLLGGLAASASPVLWLMPLLVATAVLTALWPASLAVSAGDPAATPRPARRWGVLALAAVTAVVAVANALVISFGAPQALARTLAVTPDPNSGPFALDADAPWFAPGRAILHQTPPQASRWQTAAIGQAIDKACAGRENCRTVVLSCLPAYDQAAFAYLVKRDDQAQRLIFEPLRGDADFYAALFDVDFLVGTTGDDGCTGATPETATRRQQIDTFANTIVPSASFQKRFKPLASFDSLPNGATAWILHRTGEPLANFDPARQIQELRQILAITPDSKLARQLLSQVLEAVGDPAQALALREEIVARDPNDAAARVELGDLYAAGGRTQDAADQYAAALALIDTPTRETAPGDLVALYLKLGDTYASLGRWDQAEQAFVRAVENAPTDYDTRLRQGQFYVQRGRFADATAVLQEARTLDPARPEAYIALANAYLLRDDQGRAEELFQRARNAAPGSPLPLLAWADALAQRDQMPAALDLYAQAAEVAGKMPAGPDRNAAVVDAYLRWIDALQTSGQDAQALELAQTLAREFPDSPLVRRGVGDVYRRNGQAEQAATQYQAALEAAPLDLATRLALGETLGALGRFDEAARVYEAGLEQPAGRAELYTALGRLYEVQDRVGRAVDSYGKALAANPDYYPAAVALGSLFMHLDRPNRTLETVTAALQRRPDLIPLLALQGDAYQALGRQQEALASYRAALDLLTTEGASDPGAAQQRAAIHAKIGAMQLKARNFDSAETNFRDALQLDPNAIDAHIGLGNLYLAEALADARARGGSVDVTASDETRYNQALSAFQAALAIDPESVATRVGLGDLSVAYGRANDALTYYQDALTRDPAQSDVRKKLFDLYVKQGRTQEVVAFYRQTLKDNPDSIQALTALGDALIAAGQPDEALSVFDEFLAQHPDDYGGLMAKAVALRTLGQLEDAALVYQRVIRLTPTLPQPLIDRASVLESLGRQDEALATYQRAIELIEHGSEDLVDVGPRGNLYLAYTGLARLLLAQGRLDDAETVIQTILAARPDVPQVHLLAGDLARVRGQRVQALTAYRDALGLAPGNALANVRVGDMLLEAGRLGEARDAYETALGSEPGYLPATLGLARVLSRSVDAGARAQAELTDAERATLERAQTLLQDVLAQEPDNLAAQTTLGGVLLALGQPQDAATAYQAVLLQDPEDSAAIDGLARSLLAAGDVDAALANYQAAADSAPTAQSRERWLMTLAAAYRSLGRTAEAEQTYQTLLDGDPQDPAAIHLALGDLYSLLDRLDDAIGQYRLASEAAPGSAQAAYRLGRAYLRAGDVDQAQTLSETLLQRSPSAYESHLLKARVAQARGDETAALAGLRQAANLAPTDSAVQAQVGDLYLQAGRPDDAIAAYTAAVTLNPRNSSALTGLGRLLAQQGQAQQAESALQRALALAPNDVAVQAALGRLLLTTGRADEAIPLLEGAVGQNADHPTAVQDLADAYLAAGRLEDGLAIYRTRLALDPQQEPFAIGQALLKAGQIDAAVNTYRDLVTQRPGDPLPLTALGQAYEIAGQTADAEQSYASALEADPAYVPAAILQGTLLTDQGKLEDAIRVLEAAVEQLRAAPEQVRADAAAPDEQTGFATGLSAPVRLWRAWTALGRAYLLQGRLDEALALAQEADAVQPGSVVILLQIGDIYRAMGKTAEALAAYDRAASVGGASPAPDTHKGDLYMRTEQWDEAEAAYEAALGLSPTDADALEGLARVYASRGADANSADFARAEQRFKQAIELAPGNTSAYLALGDLYLAVGRPEDAVTQYGEAVKLQPDSLAARGRLADALLAARRPEEALTEQLTRQRQAPEDRGVLLDLAAIYRALDRFDEAETTYRKLIDLAPDDPTVKIPLGDLYLERGEPDEAASLYEAVIRESSDPEIQAQARGQLGKALLRQGDAEGALAIANELIAAQPESDRGYALQGAIYEAQRRTDDAVATYEAGIARVPDALGLQLALGALYLGQGRAAEAQALFESLVAAHPNSVDAYVGLAKSHIAQAEDLKALRFEWANTALQRGLRLDPRSVPALTTQGDLMVVYGRLDEAVQAYEAALANRSSPDEDLALRTKLADAYAASGKWDQALQEYQRVAVANPSEIGPQMALGNAYRQAGRLQQALDQYRRINQVDPGYPFAYIKQGEILDELGQADAALAVYQAAVKAAPDNADAFFTLASAYRKRDRVEEAIAALQAGLAIDPNREGPLRALAELQAGQ